MKKKKKKNGTNVVLQSEPAGGALRYQETGSRVKSKQGSSDRVSQREDSMTIHVNTCQYCEGEDDPDSFVADRNTSTAEFMSLVP